MGYILFFNILLIVALWGYISNNKSPFLLGLIFFIMSIVAAFRDNTFFDYDDYICYITDPDESRLEFSFIILVYFIKLLRLPHIAVFVFYAFLGVWLKYRSIKSFSPNIWLSLMVYIAHLYISEECTAIRVGVAVGFLMFSLYELCNKRYFLWGLFTLIAIFFHYSAILSLLYPLLVKIPVKLKFCILIFVLSYLVPIMGVMTDALLGGFDNNLLNYYSHYLGSEETVNIYNFSQILYCILALYMVRHVTDFRLMNQFSGELIIIYIVSLVFLPLFYFAPVYAARGAHIFAFVEIFLFPMVIQHFWIKMRILSYFIILYIFYWCNTTALNSMNI